MMAVRATLECQTFDELISWAKQLLHESGYDVIERAAARDALHAKETPTQFCKRIGIATGTFCRRIKSIECPADFDLYCGPQGSVRWLRASKALEDFMTANKRRRISPNTQPGKTHDDN